MNKSYPDCKFFKDCGCRYDYCMYCIENPSRKITNEQLTKLNNMETITIELGGRKYKVSPVEEELTLEDCLIGNKNTFRMNGEPMYLSEDTSWIGSVGAYPTEGISNKVLLYGLLQSVAHKLNDGWNMGDIHYYIYLLENELVVGMNANKKTIQPMFYTRQRAEQAIRIFANSKFDLKKLYQ